MKELNNYQMQEVNGGLAPVVIAFVKGLEVAGTIAGAGSAGYWLYKQF